jgi:hypothetical protein
MTQLQDRPKLNMPEVGQPFNPFRVFTEILIREALVRSGHVSPGARLANGRLERYAGKVGRCFSAVSSLAREMGVSERHSQEYLGELETDLQYSRLERARMFRNKTRTVENV